MAASIVVALVIVLIVRVGATPGEKLGVALRATARWSFLLFWLAYAGGALATLFGPKFQALAHRGRDFGLSFASAHLVHLGLVARHGSTTSPRARSRNLRSSTLASPPSSHTCWQFCPSSAFPPD